MITLSSSFNQDWPDYEILFCAASEQDSAVPLVRRLIDEHPGHSARLLIGNERPTGNPKLDNLVKGMAGQAVQNLNLMLGLPEETALPKEGLWP